MFMGKVVLSRSSTGELAAIRIRGAFVTEAAGRRAGV